MKFTANSKVLLTRLQAAARAISSKNAIQILSNFLFSIRDNRLYAIASSAELYVEVEIPTVELTPGENFCVEAKKLIAIVKELADAPTSFSCGNNSLKITHSNGKCSITTSSAAEYPRPAGCDTARCAVRLATSSLIKALARTSFAAGSDELRPQLMGVFVDVESDRLDFIATDTRLMAKHSIANDSDAVGSFTIPHWAIPVINALASFTETVQISNSANRLVVEGEGFVLSTSKLKGVFPDYKRVFPSQFAYKVAVDRQTLLCGVNRVSVCTNEAYSFARFRFADSMLTMQTENNDAMRAEERIACNFAGEPIQIGFNVGNLKSILTALHAAEIEICINSPSSPAVFALTEGDCENMVLCMPVILNNSAI